MHTNSDEKVFYMKKHLLEKLHPNLIKGTPLNIFKIPKTLTEKKSYGAFKIRRHKSSKKFKLTGGAPYARCATSNRKKIGVEKNELFFKI